MTADALDSTSAAELFFSGAVAAGLRSVLISPGSRSTPLAVAATATQELTTHVHLDERTAAFAALGEAKASGRAVALICTSGTAGANYLPAIAEASMSRVPLVVITADRPPEHQHWGVGQSLDQRALYGRHVCDEITMPVGGSGGADFTERIGWRAFQTACSHQRPVHVNWAFRLPLEPTSAPQRPSSNLAPAAPFVPAVIDHEVDTLSTLLRTSRRPIAIAGPETIRPSDPATGRRLVEAIEALGVPLIADALSGLWGHGDVLSAPAHVFERAPTTPDLVLRLGHTPTTKSIRLWWEQTPAVPQVLFDPLSEWQDPSHQVTHRISGPPTATLEAVAAALPTASEADEDRSQHRRSWSEAGRTAHAIVETVLDDTEAFTEAHIGRALQHSRAAALFVSSSMPIRDLNLFADSQRPLLAYANRGINGIDGVVATAIGVSRAIDDRVLVHIGDVALLHDIGSVLDAARNGAPLTIVIPNNNGGGIFSNLPIRSAIDPDLFDQLFHTPHGQDFSFLAAVDGVQHLAVSNVTELSDAITATADSEGVVLLEARVSTSERLALRDRLNEAL